jgi:hypothetical protein
MKMSGGALGSGRPPERLEPKQGRLAETAAQGLSGGMHAGAAAVVVGLGKHPHASPREDLDCLRIPDEKGNSLDETDSRADDSNTSVAELTEVFIVADAGDVACIRVGATEAGSVRLVVGGRCSCAGHAAGS